VIPLRPCGACRALVSSETGCAHWRPGESARQARLREGRRASAEELARVRAEQDRKRAEFLRQLGIS
jgi:hypothetical protein